MDAGGSVLPISAPFWWRICDYWAKVNDARDDSRGEKRVNPRCDVYFIVPRHITKPFLVLHIGEMGCTTIHSGIGK
jgi:hypothetical protein